MLPLRHAMYLSKFIFSPIHPFTRLPIPINRQHADKMGLTLSSLSSLNSFSDIVNHQLYLPLPASISNYNPQSSPCEIFTPLNHPVFLFNRGVFHRGLNS